MNDYIPSGSLLCLGRSVCVVIFFVLVGCGSTSNDGGGYYLDDGPGSDIPTNLKTISNAEPRVEPIRKANTRPYKVKGKWYHPMAELTKYKKRGVASWYGRRFHGKKTASGEVYDMYAMTAAHPVLPIPSYARVTNIQNGRSVIVRINDRGPFLANRLIDLSYTAAHKLDMIENGRARVIVESIIPGNLVKSGQVLSYPADVERFESDEGPLVNTIYLQLGAFGSIKRAHNFVSLVSTKLPWLKDTLLVTRNNNLFKVQSGPYPDQAAAQQSLRIISQQLAIYPVIRIY